MIRPTVLFDPSRPFFGMWCWRRMFCHTYNETALRGEGGWSSLTILFVYRHPKLQHAKGNGVTCLKIMQMFLVCPVHETRPWLITLPSLCWRTVLTVVVSATLPSVDLCSLLPPRDAEATLLLRVLSLLHSPKDETCSSSRISCTAAILKKSRDGGRIGVPITSTIIHKKREETEAMSR